MEPTPPGPSLVATVWADEQCTVSPLGVTLTGCYLRVEDASSFIRGFKIGSVTPDMLEVLPLDEYGSCEIFLWADWMFINEGPLMDGDVLLIDSPGGGSSPFTVPSDYITHFYL